MPKRTSEKRELKRKKCWENYSSKAKRRAVERWPTRILLLKGILEHQDIAEKLNKKSPRISEYMTFINEPPDDVFDKIERIIYAAEDIKKGLK